MGKTKFRFQCDLDESELAMVDEVVELGGLPSRARAVRDAVAFYLEILRMKKEGGYTLHDHQGRAVRILMAR